MAGTYYFFERTNAVAYDFDDSNTTTQNTNKDRDIDDSISGSGIGTIRGATATDTRIAILTDFNLYLFDRSWNRMASEDITLPTGVSYHGVAWTGTQWVVTVRIISTQWSLYFIDTDGTHQTSQNHQFSINALLGLFADDTYIYIIENVGVSDRVQRRTFTSTTLTTFISSIGSGVPGGGTSTTSRFLIVDRDLNTVNFYNHSGGSTNHRNSKSEQPYLAWRDGSRGYRCHPHLIDNRHRHQSRRTR